MKSDGLPISISYRSCNGSGFHNDSPMFSAPLWLPYLCSKSFRSFFRHPSWMGIGCGLVLPFCCAGHFIFHHFPQILIDSSMFSILGSSGCSCWQYHHTMTYHNHDSLSNTGHHLPPAACACCDARSCTCGADFRSWTFYRLHPVKNAQTLDFNASLCSPMSMSMKNAKEIQRNSAAK